MAERDDRYSIWHQIHRWCEKEFDSAAYLRSCEKHLASDWSFGEPLITAAIARGDLAQAESFVERAAMSLLRTNEIWHPEDRWGRKKSNRCRSGVSIFICLYLHPIPVVRITSTRP